MSGISETLSSLSDSSSSSKQEEAFDDMCGNIDSVSGIFIINKGICYI